MTTPSRWSSRSPLDKEQHGLILSDKNYTFDLFCTTNNGERIIVEMQFLAQSSFRERMLYYALNPVYVISILNFKMPHEDENTLEEGMISRYDLRSPRTGEMVNAVEANQWKPVVDALAKSEKLLKATLEGDEEAVARGVELAHDENTGILSYNNENSLSCVLSIAYYYARNKYVMHRELASGKGFADIVLIPRKNVDSPAIVIELKVDKDADSALDQIRRKEYPAKVAEYAGNQLLVGISYDRQTKQHSCRIEKV